jgi:hypothetical protein
LLSVNRKARLNRDRADLNVSVKDVPTVGAFGVRAAGESEHRSFKRGQIGPANYQSLGIGTARNYSVSWLWKVALRSGRPPTEAVSTDIAAV